MKKSAIRKSRRGYEISSVQISVGTARSASNVVRYLKNRRVVSSTRIFKFCRG